MKIMALDVGQKRIGVASCDKLEIAATPLLVVKAGKDAVKQIVELIRENEVEAVVIGLPVSFDGKERESCERARAFKKQLEQHVDIKIDFYDERLTTKIAENSLIEGGMRRENRKKIRDAVAACVILQSYLSKRKANKNN